MFIVIFVFCLLPDFPSLMSSRSQPSCLYPTVLDNVAPFLRYLDGIFPRVFHWNPQGSLERSQGTNGENAFSDACGKIKFLLIFREKKKNELMMLLFWLVIAIQRLKIYKNRRPILVAAWSMRGSGDHQSQALTQHSLVVTSQREVVVFETTWCLHL